MFIPYCNQICETDFKYAQIIMKMYKLLLLLLFSTVIVTCNDDDDDYEQIATPAVNSEVVAADTEYIEWEGSANGEWVADANGDQVRFEVDTSYMNFGNTLYENVWIDEESNFLIDGILEGAVEYVAAVNGDTIVALVAPDGTYLDIVGTESELFIDNTDLPATPVSPIASQPDKTTTRIASHAHSSSSVDSKKMSVATETDNISTPPTPQKHLAPMLAPNAFTEASEEPKTNILQRR